MVGNKKDPLARGSASGYIEGIGVPSEFIKADGDPEGSSRDSVVVPFEMIYSIPNKYVF